MRVLSLLPMIDFFAYFEMFHVFTESSPYFRTPGHYWKFANIPLPPPMTFLEDVRDPRPLLEIREHRPPPPNPSPPDLSFPKSQPLLENCEYTAFPHLTSSGRRDHIRENFRHLPPLLEVRKHTALPLVTSYSAKCPWVLEKLWVLTYI